MRSKKRVVKNKRSREDSDQIYLEFIKHLDAIKNIKPERREKFAHLVKDYGVNRAIGAYMKTLEMVDDDMTWIAGEPTMKMVKKIKQKATEVREAIEAKKEETVKRKSNNIKLTPPNHDQLWLPIIKTTKESLWEAIEQHEERMRRVFEGALKTNKMFYEKVRKEISSAYN